MYQQHNVSNQSIKVAEIKSDQPVGSQASNHGATIELLSFDMEDDAKSQARAVNPKEELLFFVE